MTDFQMFGVNYNISRKLKCLINFQNEVNMTFKTVLSYLFLFIVHLFFYSQPRTFSFLTLILPTVFTFT